MNEPAETTALDGLLPDGASVVGPVVKEPVEGGCRSWIAHGSMVTLAPVNLLLI